MTSTCTCSARSKPKELLVPMLVRLPPDLAEDLRALSARTRIRIADHLREAVADLVVKYRSSERPTQPSEVSP